MCRLFSVELDGSKKAKVTYNKAIVNNVENEWLEDLLDEEHRTKLIEVTNFILCKLKENENGK